MSSGIEVLIFAPLLIPAALNTAGSVVAASGVAAGATTGGVVVSGSSIVTTSAFASGSLTAGGGVAAGASLLGGAVVVAGAAGAALLAAHHLNKSYQAALIDYRTRIENENSASSSNDAAHAALIRAQKTRFQQIENVELAFLRSSVQNLLNRLGDWPGGDPNWPGVCQQLLEGSEQGRPLDELFGQYEGLNTLVSNWIRSQVTPNSDKEKQALQTEVSSLRESIEKAPLELLELKVRANLTQALTQVDHLLQNQPKMANQAVQLLSRRVSRELRAGAERLEKERETQKTLSAQIRDLAGQISARSKATLDALEDPELNSSYLAVGPIQEIKTLAMENLQRLSHHLAGELPADLAPLKKLARETDQLFARTGDELRQIALNIYLESQVKEVFTQLGYRVTSVEDPMAGRSKLLAALGDGHGVEVHLDGNANMHSELVALSPHSTQVETDSEEKVCAIMDEVFDLLRSRGCGIREKKRRHFKKGERSLRLVEEVKKKSVESTPLVAPLAQKSGH